MQAWFRLSSAAIDWFRPAMLPWLRDFTALASAAGSGLRLLERDAPLSMEPPASVGDVDAHAPFTEVKRIEVQAVPACVEPAME